MIRLIFKSSIITWENLKRILKAIEFYENLTYFSLDLSYLVLASTFTEGSKEEFDDIIDLISGIILSFRKLKELKLRLDGIRKKPVQLDQRLELFQLNTRNSLPVFKLGSSISSLSELQSISLSFNNTNIEDYDLKYITTNLIQLTNLKDLALSFLKCTKLTDKGMEIFSECLSHKNMSKIWIGLSGCNITDQGFLNISIMLSTLPRLEELALSCLECGELKDDSLIRLSSSFTNLVHLKRLFLAFGFCPNIGQIGLINLFQSLSFLRKIRILELDFSGNPYLDKNTLIALANSIHLYNKLETFKLDISHCEKLSNKGIRIIMTGLETQKNTLLSLNLNLSYNSNISDKCIKEIFSNIRELGLLNKLDLKLTKCDNISLACIQDFNLACSKMDNLIHICIITD